MEEDCFAIFTFHEPATPIVAQSDAACPGFRLRSQMAAMSDRTLLPAKPDAVVIGAGPAGLMAADQLAAAGLSVHIAEARPSPARKFLMAGKSGLNLTKDEPGPVFRAAFNCPELDPALGEFGPSAVTAWARGLGVEVFSGTSGRVFPVGMKASPLLRAWLARLAGQGVVLHTRWRWTGWEADALVFDTPDGPQRLTPAVTVLALGGASWPRLGSDAAWAPWLRARDVVVNDFRPANMGLRLPWSAHMARFIGKPLKNAGFRAGSLAERGEAMLTATGLEGGGVYAVSAAVRDGAPLVIDLMPGTALAEIETRLATGRKGETVANLLRKTLNLDPLKIALMQEFARPLPQGAALARHVKALAIRVDGPAGIERAISSAGGVAWSGLTASYEISVLAGVFACGEMLDWEAPTGGYLLTGCLATGRWAGRAAAERALASR